jgi:hypothetical protein
MDFGGGHHARMMCLAAPSAYSGHWLCPFARKSGPKAEANAQLEMKSPGSFSAPFATPSALADKGLVKTVGKLVGSSLRHHRARGIIGPLRTFPVLGRKRT